MFVTAGVIVLTLLVQGPILPAVVRWARLPADDIEDELRLAERTVTEAAIAALLDLAEEHGVSDEVRDRLCRDYQEHLELVDSRQVLVRLRHEGDIDDSTARRIQTRLDIEELRLTGVEPLE